jgi:hypothetical protein
MGMFQVGDTVKCIDPSGTGYSEGGFVMNQLYTVYRVGSMNEAGKYLVWVEGLRGAAMYNFRFVPHKKGGFGAFLERHSL